MANFTGAPDWLPVNEIVETLANYIDALPDATESSVAENIGYQKYYIDTDLHKDEYKIKAPKGVNDSILLDRWFMYVAKNLLFVPDEYEGKGVLLDMSDSPIIMGGYTGEFYIYDDRDEKYKHFGQVDAEYIEEKIKKDIKRENRSTFGGSVIEVIPPKKPPGLSGVVGGKEKEKNSKTESTGKGIGMPGIGDKEETQPKGEARKGVTSVDVSLPGYSVKLTPDNISNRLSTYLSTYPLDVIKEAAERTGIDPTRTNLSKTDIQRMAGTMMEIYDQRNI